LKNKKRKKKRRKNKKKEQKKPEKNSLIWETLFWKKNPQTKEFSSDSCSFPNCKVHTLALSFLPNSLPFFLSFTSHNFFLLEKIKN